MIESAQALPVIDHNRGKLFGIKRQWLDLLQLLVLRDLRVRYRGSVLGYFWSMLNPLLYMIILTLVFSHVVKVKTDTYALFILSGIMGWNLFHQSISIGMNSIISSGHLLKKVSIPGILFPTSSLAGVLVNFVLSLLPFLVISLLLKNPLSWTMLLLPLFLIPYLAFVWGIVVTIACINVKYRDVGHAMEPILQMLFYATPVVYPLDIIPERWRFILELNPISHFLSALRGLLIGQQLPSIRDLGLLLTLSLVSAMIGLYTYRKSRGEFIYNL
jgi:ABC-type polysaccharide/polyol phosphate export permease